MCLCMCTLVIDTAFVMHNLQDSPTEPGPGDAHQGATSIVSHTAHLLCSSRLTVASHEQGTHALPCMQVGLFRVTIGGRHTFGCVNMRDFLAALAKAVKPNSTAWDNFQRMYVPSAQVPSSEPGSPLRTNIIFKHIQVTLS